MCPAAVDLQSSPTCNRQSPQTSHATEGYQRRVRACATKGHEEWECLLLRGPTNGWFSFWSSFKTTRKGEPTPIEPHPRLRFQLNSLVLSTTCEGPNQWDSMLRRQVPEVANRGWRDYGRGHSRQLAASHALSFSEVTYLRESRRRLWFILLGCWDFDFLPTRMGFPFKPRKVKLLAGEQKATQEKSST